MPGFRPVTQLMTPDGVEIPRVLEELDRGHVNLVEVRDITCFPTREADIGTDCLEEALHMRDRCAFGMNFRFGRSGMEARVQPLDLIGVEDAVGFHEGDGFGVFGFRLVFVDAFFAVPFGGAVINDHRRFRALDDLRIELVRLSQRHPVGRGVSGHHGAHGQQEVVDALIGFAVLTERHGTAADGPGLAPGQHAPVDDLNEFVGDRCRGVELWLAGFGHDDLRCLVSVQTRRYRWGNTLGGDGRVRPEPCQTPTP